MTNELMMKETRAAAAASIAEQIRDMYPCSEGMPFRVGIDEDGEITSSYSGARDYDTFFVVFYESSDWSLGDFEGDFYKEEDWDDESEAAIAQAYKDGWIDDAINADGVTVDVYWQGESGWQRSRFPQDVPTDEDLRSMKADDDYAAWKDAGKPGGSFRRV